MQLLAVFFFFSVHLGRYPTSDDSGKMLEAHNYYRAQVGSPPLKWSKELAMRATQWALSLVEQDRYGLRRDGIFGENLFEITGAVASPVYVVGAWASEKKNYNAAANICSARCGHYTQVVWRATRLVGCGVARDSRREVWVCNYDPPGNIVGERPY